MTTRLTVLISAFATLALLACGSGSSKDGSSFGSAETGGSSDGESSEAEASSDGGSEDDSGGVLYDVGAGSDDECKVGDDMDGVAQCGDKAPPDSFEPDVQWEWMGEDHPNSVVTPLVANLTDDNGDGEIDLCDTPDIIVVAYAEPGEARIYALDGATGAVHFRTDRIVPNTTTPAVGDIDGDGLPEIVTGTPLVIFEHDGSFKLEGEMPAPYGTGSWALADLDNDGDVEIIQGQAVWDHEGKFLWAGDSFASAAMAGFAVDLDGDEDLEVVSTRIAYHHDGSVYFANDDVEGLGLHMGYTQVADLDDDGLPEVLSITGTGLHILEHDGTTKVAAVRPTGEEPAGNTVWMRPGAIHDFDGDGAPEIASKSKLWYSLFDVTPDGTFTIQWSTVVDESSGMSGGTAFDFIGDGVAEAIYADEHDFWIFDGVGGSLMTIPRTSYTADEYPIVADVDNDGSAEAVVVSNAAGPVDLGYDPPSPTVQVIRDVEDRWIPARRIWNQHAYHVTNVREDGTIPQFQPKHWESLNTFRTQAQIDEGGICKPTPEG